MMTRKEAVDQLVLEKDYIEDIPGSDKTVKALEMAIESLEKEQRKTAKWIPVDETIYVCEAHYRMPYHELDAIVAFIFNHEWEDIPESLKDNLPKYKDFLVDNL